MLFIIEIEYFDSQIIVDLIFYTFFNFTLQFGVEYFNYQIIIDFLCVFFHVTDIGGMIYVCL